MAERPFIPGFRISSFDVGVLIAGALGALLVGSRLWWAGTLIGFVVSALRDYSECEHRRTTPSRRTVRRHWVPCVAMTITQGFLA